MCGVGGQIETKCTGCQLPLFLFACQNSTIENMSVLQKGFFISLGTKHFCNRSAYINSARCLATLPPKANNVSKKEQQSISGSTSSPTPTTASAEAAIPPKYGKFRQPPASLGSTEPPVIDQNTWFQRKKQALKDFTDFDKAFAAHAAERRYLVEQATKSYFADVHGSHGGKMYFASTQLIKPDKAGYMPNFEAQNLFRKTVNTTETLVNKISLMSFFYNKFGESHVETFIQPFLDKYRDTKDVQLVEMNVQENYLKQYLLKAFVPMIRRNLPLERRDNYYLLYRDIGRVRKFMDMTNQHIGYVFLIDENCRIRWTAHGKATEEEIANMLAMTDYLKQKKEIK
ncbi:ATP10 protein-domain-containing protein [Mycotypha africana]|uniref:ATP10 protein-domain-containing protein n=1 Tax=Mycotypha africana TaxID=64632 RepID=UPI002300E818|nr:ATP10 protein-domain-containing protein [Mycotypha africana]KAI8976997.1 ATP10 protein-domain-containing protein [Mycotypha africana]